jgi:hypothetical protein
MDQGEAQDLSLWQLEQTIRLAQGRHDVAGQQIQH